MKTMRAIEVSSLNAIPQAWLYKDHKYTYLSHGKPVTLLPSVVIEHKDLLDALQVPYRQIDDGKKLEVWDSACYKETEITLPLYVCTGNTYRYIKDYTGIVVTNETTDAAFALWENKLYPEITKRDKEKRQKQMIVDLGKTLAGRIACGADTTLKIPDLTLCARRETYVNTGDAHYKVFPVRTLMSEKRKLALLKTSVDFLVESGESFDNAKYTTDFIAIFNLDKVHKDAVVDMLVPNGAEAIFVGKNGWQVREWCRQLGLKKIIVRGA